MDRIEIETYHNKKIIIKPIYWIYQYKDTPYECLIAITSDERRHHLDKIVQAGMYPGMEGIIHKDWVDEQIAEGLAEIITDRHEAMQITVMVSYRYSQHGDWKEYIQ